MSSHSYKTGLRVQPSSHNIIIVTIQSNRIGYCTIRKLAINPLGSCPV